MADIAAKSEAIIIALGRTVGRHFVTIIFLSVCWIAKSMIDSAISVSSHRAFESRRGHVGAWKRGRCAVRRPLAAHLLVAAQGRKRKSPSKC